MKLDERTLSSFEQLRAPPYQPFLEWLKVIRLEHMEACVASTDPERKARLSGRAQQLQDITDAIMGSTELVKKLARSNRTT